MCEFVECAECAKKVGAVELCEGCYQNRKTIFELRARLQDRDVVEAKIDKEFAAARERIKALEWVIRIQSGHKE